MLIHFIRAFTPRFTPLRRDPVSAFANGANAVSEQVATDLALNTSYLVVLRYDPHSTPVSVFSKGQKFNKTCLLP